MESTVSNPSQINGVAQYSLDAITSETVQLFDNDIAPNVWIDHVEYGREGFSHGRFILKRDSVVNDLSVAYSLDYSQTTAGHNSDFTFHSGTIFFAAGSDTAELIVNIIDDTIIEWTETVRLVLSSPTQQAGVEQYHLVSGKSSATLNIHDNDGTFIWFDSVINGIEGEKDGQFILKRDNTSTQLTIYYRWDEKNSTAIRDEDFSNMPGMTGKSRTGSVTFEVGEDTVIITVPVIDDSLVEHPKSVTITLSPAREAQSSPPSYTFDTAQNQATLYIEDNDVKPQVWFEAKQDATEGQENGYARVWRSDATNSLRISYRINDTSTGILGQDYDYPPGMSALNTETGFITFAKGAYYVDIPIRVIDNSLLDGTRTVSITIIPGDEIVGGVNTIYDIDESRNTIDVSIFDDDVKTTLRIGEIQNATEGGENGYIRVDRDNSRTELTFNYIFDSAGSTAIMGDDFAQLPGMKSDSTFGTFTFKAGESSVYIPITVFDDNLIETDKTVRIVLTTGNGNYELDENFEAIVAIKDNDRPTNIRIETIQHGIEGEQDIFIRLHRDQTDKPLTITFEYDKNASTAILGTDFEAFAGMLYGSNVGTVQFGIGEEFVDIPIKLINDNLVEADKTILIRLHQGDQNSASSYFIIGNLDITVAITDPDEITKVWLGETEDTSEGLMARTRIYRDNTAGTLNVRLQYNDNISTAQLDTDFKFGGIFDQVTKTILVTFADGQEYVDLPVYTLTDPLLENDETVSLTVLNGSGYIIEGTPDATLTILDVGLENPVQESPRVGVIATDPYASENGRNTAEFTIARAGQSDLSQPLTVHFSISGTSTLNLDYEGINATYDSATQTWIGSVTIPAGQSHYVLTVTPLLDDLTEGTENIVLTLLPSNEIDELGQPRYAISSANSATVQIEDKTEPVDPGTEPGVVEKTITQVTISATDAFASENSANTGEVTVIRSGGDLSLPLVVGFVLSGTAALNTDYNGLDAVYDSATQTWRGFITFQENQTKYVLNIIPVTDGERENTETVILTLLPTTDTDENDNLLYHIGNESSAVIQIEDSVSVIDPNAPQPVITTKPVITVTATDPYASENGQNTAELTISRSATSDLSKEITVHFEISGTGTLNTDYTGLNEAGVTVTFDSATKKYRGSVTLQSGQRHFVIKITPAKDSLTESTETVILTLLPSEEIYTVGESSIATIEITDATKIYEPVPEPTVKESWDVTVIAADAFSSENPSNSGRVTFYRFGLSDLSQPLTVYFEISGTAIPNADYNGMTLTWDPYTYKYRGSVTFQPGQSEVSLNINPLRDSQHESSETVVVTLIGTTEKTPSGESVYHVGTNNSATITIEDEKCVAQGTPYLSGDPEMREGGLYRLELHANNTNILRWEIDWGDGRIDTISGTETFAEHFYADGNELYTINAKAIEEMIIPPASGSEGFSVSYWTTHLSDWTQYHQNNNYETIFGVPAYVPAGTLLNALTCADKPYDPYGNTVKDLWHESVAALLNAAHPNIEYKYSVQEVIAIVQSAYWTGQYATYAAILKTENAKGGNIQTGASEQHQEKTTNLQKTLCIKNVVPTLVISGESKSLPNENYVLNLSSSDPGDDTITSWTIHWGDGTETVVGGNPSSVSHVYDKSGNFQITATATDEDGTWHANVLDVHISVPENGIIKGSPWVSGDPEMNEGRTYTLDLHANDANILRWMINWGDGSATETINGTATSATHVYADGDAQFEISIIAVKEVTTNSQNNQNEGLIYCYWKQYPSNWCFYQSNDYYASIFGLQNYNGFQNPGSLMQSLKCTGNDAISNLWRESTTALLNASHWGVNYCYSLNQVISFVQQAYSTGQYDYYANCLKTANYFGGKIDYSYGYNTAPNSSKTELEINLEKTVFIRNVAPELTIVGAPESAPGAVYVLNLSSFDPGQDTITRWVINWGNGQETIVEGNPSQTSYVYENVGEYVITAIAVDEDGMWNANSVTVNVAVPETSVFVKTPWISGDPEILEGREYVLDLHQNDADILRWEIDWGDGSEKQIVDVSVLQVTHFYADGDEQHTITVTAIKEQVIQGDDQSGTLEGFSVEYWKNNLSSWIGFSPTDKFEGVFGVYSCWSVGTLLDALNTTDNPYDWYSYGYRYGVKALQREAVAALLNASNPNVNFKYSVDDIIWKVRTAYATGMYQLYADCLHIENNRGGDIATGNQTPDRIEEIRLELTKQIFVRNVAPTLVIAGEHTSKPGIEYILNLTSSDPGDDTITSWVINWGDGTEPEIVTGNPQIVTHIYTQSGLFTISAKATDEDGTWNANTVDVEITVPAVPWISGDPEILEGREYVLDLHKNNATITQWIIDWGDGSALETIDGSLDKATHLYADGDESRTISVVAVKAVDNGTENIDLVKEIFVRNVAPELVISGNTSTFTNSDYVLNLTSSDPGDDTITHWIINWGDGSEPETIIGNPNTWTHRYLAPGDYVITATATDEDGTWNANTVNVQVQVFVPQTEWIRLVEDDRFVTEYRTTFTVQNGQAMVLDIRNLQFDGQSENMINDAFEVALVDQNGYPLTATIRTTRDGFLNVTEGYSPILASGVLYDAAAGQIILDLSKIAVGTNATLIVRLVNNDTDTKTSVELNPVLSFIASPFGTVNNTTPQENSGNRQQINFVHLQDITSNIKFEYGTTTFNDQKNILRAGLTLINDSYKEFRGPILVGIRNISDPSVSVTGYDGMTPDGMYYFDVSHFAFSGRDYTFSPDEIIRGLDLQFLNPDHVQFTYDIVVLAHINTAPTFVSTPKTNIVAGNEYVYNAGATDPENDTLRYEKIFGPETMIIDAETGRLTWKTTSDDVGTHSVVIRVYDTEGLRDEQKFFIDVTETINHPPYFTSTPETEAFVGTIYHYQATADDPDGDHLTYSLVDAIVTKTGEPLTNFAPTHWMTVTDDGKVTWNPPVDLVGETITVTLEVNDGKSGTALQTYLIGVHADPVNRPPVIVTKPSTTHVLPSNPNDPTGSVYPKGIDLELAPGETAKVNVEIDVAPVQKPIENLPEGEPDKMVVYNETDPQKLLDILLSGGTTGIKVTSVNLSTPPSGSYSSTGYYVNNNETYGMSDYGIVLSSGNAASYGSGGNMTGASSFEFGGYQTTEQQEILQKITGSSSHYDVTQFDINFDMLPGYDTLVFNLVFGSEEYPEWINQFIDGFGLLVDGENIAFVDGRPINIDHPNMRYVPGTELDGILLNDPDDPESGVLTFMVRLAPGSTNHKLTFIIADMGDMAYDTTIFISNLGGTTSRPMDIDVNASKENADVTNTSGVITGVMPGETAVFEVEITGTGSGDYFDLQFTDTITGAILGSIPVRLNSGYFYLLQAVDPDGDTLIYSMPTAPEGATINPATGAIKWNPPGTGAYTFTVRVEDGRGGYDEQTFTVNVTDSNAGNKPPVIEQISDCDVAVGNNVSWQVQANDADGDVVYYHLIEKPEGMTIDSQTGVINWSIPLEAAAQSYTIKVLALDRQGGESTMEFIINVAENIVSVNHQPVISSEPAPWASVGNYYRYKVNASDPDHDKLHFYLGTAPEGAFIDAETGELFWRPTSNQVGWNAISVIVEDGHGGSTSQFFYIGVFETNQQPEISSFPENPPSLNIPWQYQVVATDPDGDTLIYSLDETSIRNGFLIDADTGLLTWTPETTGRFNVLITVDDGRGGIAYQPLVIDVNEALAPPQITSQPTGPAFIGETWTYEIVTDQPEGTYTLTLSDEAKTHGLELDGNTLSWNPTTPDQVFVTLTLTDQYGGTYTQTFTIEARAKAVTVLPPEITSEPFGHAYVGEDWTYQIIATDPADYAINYYLVEEDGSLTLLDNGLLTWQPSETGTHRFTIRAENEHGAWTEQSFTLNIVARPTVNNPPVITSVPTGPAMVGNKYQYQVTAYDPDGDVLSYLIDDNSAANGVTIDQDGLLQWIPTLAGSQIITVTVIDAYGNGQTQTFELGVDPQPIVSRPPIITSKPSSPAYVDEEWSYTINAYDPEQGSITYWLVDENGTKTQIDQTITWTPTETGEKTFTIRVEDQYGFWTEQSFIVNAIEVPVQNSPPIFTSVPTGPAFVGERYEYQVTAQTFDGTTPTFSLDEISQQLGITINSDGRLTWIPATAGDIPITIFVKDGSGNEIAQAFILAVVTRPVVTVPPTITSKPTGPAYVGEAWNYNVTATATDNGAVKFYLVTSDGETIQEIVDGHLVLTWNTTEPQTLIIRAVDSNDAWSEQKFTIQVVEHVVATNDPPVIRSVPTEQTRLDKTYQYRINAYDPNGDTLTYKLQQAPSGASLSGEGVLTWDPSQTGQYEFVIIVSDSEHDIAQEFTLTVLPPVTVNTPPVITSILTSGAMKDRLYQYQATATDVDGDTIIWSIDVSEIPESARGDIQIDAATGLFTWTPRVAGSFTFKIIASDGKDSDIRIITLPVANNAPPQITALPEPNGFVGDEYVSKIEAYDPNGDALTYQLENAPEGLTVAADGTLTWTNPVTGRYTVTAIVTDSEGAVARRQFELRITDPTTPNNAPKLESALPGSIPVNKQFTAYLSAFDEDGDVVTFKLIEGPEGMIISSNGQIEWTPQSLGTESFKVEISDGKSNVVYTYTIEVVAQRENHQPQFISEPPQSIVAGKTLTYKPVAVDEDNDSVTITIIESPTGMTLNTKGEIIWTPSSSLVGQKVTVKLRATDSYGASVDQVFEIAVRSVVLAPVVDMTQPLPTGFVGQKMTFQIKATDPQGEKLTYILEGIKNLSTETALTNVGDVKLDPNTGLLSYTPMAELADNIIGFRIRVQNESGVSTPIIVFPMAVYDLTGTEPIDPGNPDGPTQPTYNNPPQIQLPESHYVEAGKVYNYPITAIDGDNDTLTFTLIDPPSGMTINSNTGVITWTPSSSLIGQAIKVSVSVSDGRASSSGYFYLGITAPNNLPTIKTIPDQSVTAGSKFQYYVNATDKDYNDTLTYSLNQSALDLGIKIDSQSGLITWSPTKEQIRAESYSVTVYVTDGRDEPVAQTFNIRVIQDTQAPNVTITATPPKTAAGQTVTIYVNVTDNVGVKNTVLKLVSVKNPVTGETVTVNKEIKLENGKAVYTLADSEFGILTFGATATDDQGNISATATTTVQAIDPTDTESPTVAISSHSQGSKIVGPVDIIGTVKDNEQGVSWTLKAYSLDTGKEVLISEGTGNIINGVLGRFDTTMLRNGTWQIVLEAVDVGGNKSERYFNVELEGDYKLGNFTMTFTDFDLQLGGLPITITRTYDTLNADSNGDFGYGWTLDIATTEISVVIGDGSGAQKGFSRYEPISDGTHITIILPDGTKEGFTFQAVGGGYSTGSMYEGMIPSQYYKPSWIPDPGTKSTLQADDTWLYAWGDGTYYVMDSYDLNQSDYSPANANGGFLTLTLRNGVDLVIDATNGQLHQAIDMNGNTLTFTERGITHSSGKCVVFERDYQGRITSITGPDGKKVTYTYDSKGDLVAVTDTSNATVQFTYLTDPKAPEHYLDTVIDPLGRSAAKTEFDEQGRIKKVIDADGKVIEYEFDTGSKIQKVKDQLGNVTVIENDDRGNVIREVSPEGAITLRTYDGNNNMLTETQVVIHNGVEIKLTTTYTYDADGNKLTETDARGNVTSYTYNKYGQVTSTTSGGVTTYTHYDSQTGLPTTTTDVNGNTTNYKFDDRGNMTSLVNSNGVQLITSEYNKYGEVTSITSTNGRTTYMEYDNNGDCIATYYIENGYKILDKTFYDDARRVIGREHWIIQMGAGVQPLGGGTSNIAPPKLLWSTKTEYNAAGQVIREIDQNGLETLYTYDVRGLETEVRSQSKGSDGIIIWTIQRTVYDATGKSIYSNSFVEGIPATQINGSYTEYDKDGRSVRSEQLLGLVIEIGPNGQSFVKSIGTVLSSSSTVYNTAGWVLSSTDSYGLVTKYTYNVFGETTQTRRQLIGGGWLVSETVYDSQGRVIFSTDSHLEGSTDPIYGTKSIYDEKGRSIGSIRYENCLVSIAVDGSSIITVVGTEIYRTQTEYNSKGQVKSSTDAYGNTTTYEYDNLDRQVKVIQANGLINETIYNSKGQVWKSVIRSGSDIRTTEYKYDIYGNIIETIQPDNTSIKAEYNDKGQKISETNQLNQTRYFEYDENGQLVKVILPDGATYKYAYDAQGNQISIIDPLKCETKFTYDNNGNQLTRTLPDGSTEYFEYDYKERFIKQISFEGVETIYNYDVFDRLASKTFTVNGITETWAYTYDSLGRVSGIDQNGRITKTIYDSQGRTKLIETPEGIISYTYDEFGRQTSVQTDNDQPTLYNYDNFGRLHSVTSDGKTTTYEYDAFDNLIKTKLPNDVTTIYQYDNMNRLIKLSNFDDKNNNGIFDNGEGVSEFSYLLDNLGRKNYAFEKFWTEYSEQENEIDWEYDEAGRLIYEKFDHYNDEFDQTSEWIYDLVGNRLKQTVNGTITTYNYDVNDRLLNEVTNNKTTIYGYDHTQQTSKQVSENGNLVSETTFEYDLQGRMSIVTIVSGNRTEITRYGYGTDGIRVSAEHEVWEDGELKSKTKTEYLNDPLNITGYSQVLKQTETDIVTSEETVTTYVIGHQRISQIIVKNGMEQEYYFTFDGHGSTRVLTDFVGTVIELYNYDAYGNALGFNSTEALTEFLYSGEQFDSKIGQQYLRARYYDLTAGRFNRLDPFFGNLTDPQSLHKYLYTHADPVNGIDPSGKFLGVALAVGFGCFGTTSYNSRVIAQSIITGTAVGGYVGGYSGVLMGLMAYDFDADRSALSGFLWGIIGAWAGATPGLQAAGLKTVAKIGVDVLNNLGKAARTSNVDPIQAALRAISDVCYNTAINKIRSILLKSADYYINHGLGISGTQRTVNIILFIDKLTDNIEKIFEAIQSGDNSDVIAYKCMLASESIITSFIGLIR